MTNLDEVKSKLKKLVNKKTDFADICKELDVNEYELIGLVRILNESGDMIDYKDGKIIKLNKSVDSNKEIIIPSKDNVVKFLALSDVHYGSNWDNPRLVEYAYEIAEKEQVDFITNSGDIFDGDFKGKRPDHIYQVKAHGMQQLDYAVKKYPKSDIPTYYISGNHDATFIKTCGADICKMLAKERPDLTYLGSDVADIKVGKLKIRLRHGSGGNAYAKGYKLQRYCETLPVDDLPNIILQGHFHYSAYFKNRDIHCFNVPSLQGYTPYAKSLGLPQEMGFWLITCGLTDKGDICTICPELYQFDEKVKAKRRRNG